MLLFIRTGGNCALASPGLGWGEGQQEALELRAQPGGPSTCQGWSTANHCTQSFDLAWFVVYIFCSLYHYSTSGLYKRQTKDKDKQTVVWVTNIPHLSISLPLYLFSSISQISIATVAPDQYPYTSHQVTGLGSGCVAAFPKP